MRSLKLALFSFAAALLLLQAPVYADGHGHHHGGELISDPFARATPGSAKNGAAFMVLHSEEGDRLVSGSSPASETVELHTHVNDNGVMRMREVEAIELPAGEKVMLKPGGLHVMFMGLKAPLQEGEMVEVTLTFEKAGTKTVTMPIKAVGAMKHGHDHGHGDKGHGHKH